MKKTKKERREARVRAKVFGTKKVPRLSVFRSLKYISAQLIDDEKGETLVCVSDRELNKKPANTEDTEKTPRTQKKIQSSQRGSESSMIAGKVLIAHELGKLLAKKALDKKIKKCVFDKSGYKYHGRVKAVAEGARAGGLRF